MLYGENSERNPAERRTTIALDGGLNVWVRSSASRPAQVPTGGPDGRGAFTFDRALAQHLDGGPRTFNLASDGFTAVAVVRFTSVGAWERIFDMGKGMNDDNIFIARRGTTNTLQFSIRNTGSECALLSATDAVVLNTWLTIVAIYDHNDKHLRMRIGSTIITPVNCGTARTNRDVVNTRVGRSNFNDAIFSGSIAGLYVVDALLSATEIAEVVLRIHAGEDTLQRCAACPAGSFKAGAGPGACDTCALQSSSPPASTSAATCACLANFHGPPNGPCAACPANSESPAGSALASACKCLPGFGRVDDACVECIYMAYIHIHI